MRLKPTRFLGNPSIKITPSAQERATLSDKEPTPMDWLARLVAVVLNDDWTCNASNVFDGYVVFVPQWKGWILPERPILERSLDRLMKDLQVHLETAGFTVEGRK